MRFGRGSTGGFARGLAVSGVVVAGARSMKYASSFPSMEFHSTCYPPSSQEMLVQIFQSSCSWARKAGNLENKQVWEYDTLAQSVQHRWSIAAGAGRGGCRQGHRLQLGARVATALLLLLLLLLVLLQHILHVLLLLPVILIFLLLSSQQPFLSFPLSFTLVLNLRLYSYSHLFVWPHLPTQHAVISLFILLKLPPPKEGRIRGRCSCNCVGAI